MTKRLKKTTKQTIAERRDKIIADIEAKIEGQLIIARHGDGWALIAKTNFWQDDPDAWHCDPKGIPWVLYDGLQSKEAAEIAMACAREAYFDEVVRHPLGYDIPGDEAIACAWLNAVGRILEVLLETDSISDLSKPNWAFVARRAYWAAMDQQPPRNESANSECPF